jgi:hypothetical protein
MKVFDYLFFRLYTFYEARDKKGSPLFTSALYLSFIQIVLLYVIVSTFVITTKDHFNILIGLRENKNLAKASFVILSVLLDVMNYIRYDNRQRRDELRNRYKSNKLNQRFDVWMLVPIVILLIFLPAMFSKVIGLF